jgi:hypothetical protein
LREQIATFIPSLAKEIEIARPMPFVEPVIRAFFILYFVFYDYSFFNQLQKY